MESKTNILLICTDQHAKSSIGAYGSRICRTPHLDRLAEDALVFDHAYTTCPVCSPARASLQTGLYPFRHGMQTNIFQGGCMIHELADTPALLSRRLAAAGYAAGHTGKWHLGYGEKNFSDDYYNSHIQEIDLDRDFIDYPRAYREATGLPTAVGYIGDDFPGHGGGGHAYPQYLDYLKQLGKPYCSEKHGEFGHIVTSSEETTMDYFLVERSKAIIDELQGTGKPWFHALNFWGPHEPYHTPQKYFDLYRDTEILPWESFGEDQDSKPKIHWALRNGHDWDYFQEELRLYYAYTTFIDAQIGRLLNYLKTSGQINNTLIIFTADHGDSMGIHAGLTNKSMHLYEETASIPLIIRPAGGCALRREERFANTTDIYSTILDIAGVEEVKTRRHGRSLMPLVRSENPSDWPQEVVVESSGLGMAHHSSRMIRHGNIKYIFNCADLDELYDLDLDPHELCNRVSAPEAAVLLREMRERLACWMRGKHDPLSRQYANLIRGKEMLAAKDIGKQVH